MTVHLKMFRIILQSAFSLFQNIEKQAMFLSTVQQVSAEVQQ